MATASSKPRRLALYTETQFVEGGPADWSTNGTYFYATAVDTAAVVQQTVANENNVTHPREKHDNIRTRRVSSFSFGCYLHGNPSPAAEAAAATTFHLAALGHAALGGLDLGWSAAVVTSGAEEDDEIEIATNPGYAVGDFVYYKGDGGTGQFYRILAIAAGPPITLTVDRVVHVAVEDRSEADTLRAVIDLYVHGYATTQPDHASHKTMQFLVQGDLSDDVQVMKGCKPTMTIAPIQAGTPLQLQFEVAVTTFLGADEATQEDFGSAVPVGEAPLVPGLGTSTKVWIADVGSELEPIVPRGQMTLVPGVAFTAIETPGGNEGVVGYTDSELADITLEMMVNFDGAYNAEFRANTHKTVLIQVGDGDDSVGFFYPELEHGSDPARNEEGSITGSSLSFRALLNSASPGGLTGDNLEKWKSGFHMLLVA